MRNEETMLGLILRFATDHDDIRAVVMNGSRVNPNLKRDPFQDYDIVYLVRSVEPYKRNQEVTSFFGDMLILQIPEEMVDPLPENDGSYGYLMQFLDGNRIDLTFCPLKDAQRCVEDSLSVVLLDKDHIFGQIAPPSERSYLPEKPTAKLFADCCNEFWWLNPYVAKGLWRGELTYAKYILESIMRPQLMRMLIWYFGIKTDFQKAPGKQGKNIKGQLGEALWALLEQTYSDFKPEHIWDSLFAMDELFRKVSHQVADAFGFTVPDQDDKNVTDYIRRIQLLPRDAKTID